MSGVLWIVQYTNVISILYKHLRPCSDWEAIPSTAGLNVEIDTILDSFIFNSTSFH